ncbi:C2 calcium-dependent membrane targeting [Artemisia annua]|uniref:C2 calcium-dependent membrane targeting n=1 Tax=Artemisia annua TaxID=35608 RepID=A0A2U1NMX1_ARTAN|nr:C2 calcium-dependent membrane targeting [Artemisia annua]
MESKYGVNVFVRGTNGKKHQITPVLKNTGSSELTRNFQVKFTIDEAAGLEDRLNLVIRIKAVKWMFFSKTLVKVRVRIKDLVEGITKEGKESQLVSYPIVNEKAELGASLTFSYKFRKIFLRTTSSELEVSCSCGPRC